MRLSPAQSRVKESDTLKLFFLLFRLADETVSWVIGRFVRQLVDQVVDQLADHQAGEQLLYQAAKAALAAGPPGLVPSSPSETAGMVVPLTARLATVAALIDTGALLDGTKVILFQNNITVSAYTLLADLTLATFSGYAISAAIVWGDPYINASQQAESAGGSIQFTQTADTVTNIIYGYAVITDASPDVLQFAENFATPVAMAGIGSACIVIPRFTYPS